MLLNDVAALNRRLQHNHFQQWLGLTAVDAQPGEVELHVPWRQETESSHDGHFVHGGILAALIDTAAALAIRTIIDRSVRTLDMRVDYHAAARGALSVRGKVIKAGRTIATSEAWVYNADGVLAASGRAAFFFLASPDP